GVRRVPRLRGVVVAQPLAIVMANDRRALAAARPVLARLVLARRERRSIRLRACQNVVHVDGLALLAQRRLLVQLVVGAMEVGDAARDRLALGAFPRPLPDAIACVHRRLAVGRLRREVSMPGLLAGTGRRGQRLAVLV